MNTEVSPGRCPKCGTPVPAEAPQGLCPKCVLADAAAPTEIAQPPEKTAEVPALERVAAAFPQLEIIELLGHGGMGAVYKARQPKLDRVVALKLLHDSLATNPAFAERFNREARMLARLNHPNIVTVYDFGEAGGFFYLLMEYVDGVNMRQAMQAGRFSPAEALGIVPKICEALQFAHNEGILHRDIKPENILIDARGRVKIADFGIAKLLGDGVKEVRLTASGAAVGTPHYMAPEQLERPQEVDHRADIYSLGVVFYEMLTGELPIGRFAPPSQKAAVDPRVDDVVFRTLEKEREKRYQSAGEVKTSVEGIATGKPESVTGKTIVTAASAGGVPPSPSLISHGISNASEPLPAAPTESRWSQKAIWGSVLTALSFFPILPVLVLMLAYASARRGGGMPVVGFGVFEIIIFLAASIVPGLAGTILGSLAIGDLRRQPNHLHGRGLALFAALGWPLLTFNLVLILTVRLVVLLPFVATIPLLLTLILIAVCLNWWLTSAAWRRAHGLPGPGHSLPPEQKWRFRRVVWPVTAALMLPLLLLAIAWFVSKTSRAASARAIVKSSPVPIFTLTVTAVELREDAQDGRHWLAIDFAEDTDCDCELFVRTARGNPDEIPVTRKTYYLKEVPGRPPVKHQRVEWQLPTELDHDARMALRETVASEFVHQTMTLRPGDERLVLNVPLKGGGTFAGYFGAKFKGLAPLK